MFAAARVGRRRFAKTLASLQTLIIDEASMVRADVFLTWRLMAPT